MKTNIFKIMSLSTLLLLSGCSARYLSSSDPAPVSPDTTDSVAMQSLKQGLQFIPWKMEDTLVAEDSTLSSGNIVYSTAIIGGVISGLSGSWLNVASFAPNPKRDYMYITAYVPADNIDISDKKAIEAYIRSNYIVPAINRFIANEKDTNYPTKLVDKNKLTYSGNICRFMQDDVDLAAKKTCTMGDTYHPIRYATPESGLIFEPEVNAKRYIVATTVANGYFHQAMYIPYIDTNMIFTYVPAKEDVGISAEYVTNLNPDLFLPVPSVRNLDTIDFFVKVKPE